MKQSTIIKKYNNWRKGLENNDPKVKPYYVISYQYYESAANGTRAILMNFNLSLKKAQEYLLRHHSTVTNQEYLATIEIVNAFEDMSFFDKNVHFELKNNDNWH